MISLVAALCLQATTVEPPSLDNEALDRAIEEVARCVRASAKRENESLGVAWPIGVNGKRADSASLYSGSPGAILFLLEQGLRCDDEASLEMARDGARQLARMWSQSNKIGHGFYTGTTGLIFTVEHVARRLEDPELTALANEALEKLYVRCREDGSGLRGWIHEHDVISGMAGVGLYLVDVAERDRESGGSDARPLEFSVLAADDLLGHGVSRDGGLAWTIRPDTERAMPGLSHGTAGVGLLLVRVAEELRHRGDPRAARFLAGAIAAAAHLRGIADEQPGGGCLVHHSTPGNEELYYLGWCHGPPGTARFLAALERATGDATWGRFADELIAGLAGAGLPDTRPDGYWDNVGLCCGAAGIAQFLERYSVARGEPRPALVDALTLDVLERATAQPVGIAWTHCEHRARPSAESTQLGLMQGASGIGLWLLERRYGSSGVVLPDDPLGSPR